MKSANKKRVLALAAAFVVVAILMGGTYAAYVKFDQATNRGTGYGALALANLVENFEEKSNWRVTDPAVKKEIRVENIGGTEQFGSDAYSDIYTRISLKEYMDISPMTYEYFIEDGQTAPGLFLIQRTDGLFVRFPDTLDPANSTDLDTIKGDAQWDNVVTGGSASAYVLGLTEDDFVLAQSVEDALTDTSYYYVRTKAGDPNGQYGRMLPVARVAAETISVDGVVGPIDHALIDEKDYGHYDDEHETDEAIECTFTEHSWKDGGLSDAFREYVSWLLGDDVILYSEWEASGEAVKKWILDDRDTADAWAYWGAAVPPGESTKNLLRSVKLEKQPDGDFYYVIHADMQAVDYAGLDTWEADNEDIVAALRNAALLQGEDELKLNMLSYKPADPLQNDRIFFHVQDCDPGTMAPWEEENWIMTLDYVLAASNSAVGHIVIPLASVVKGGQGVNLADVEITDIQSPEGYDYTDADIYIEDEKIISKGLMSWDDFFDTANFEGLPTGWVLEVPVVITLTDSVSGKSAEFTVINMYTN